MGKLRLKGTMASPQCLPVVVHQVSDWVGPKAYRTAAPVSVSSESFREPF